MPVELTIIAVSVTTRLGLEKTLNRHNIGERSRSSLLALSSLRRIKVLALLGFVGNALPAQETYTLLVDGPVVPVFMAASVCSARISCFEVKRPLVSGFHDCRGKFGLEL